jgi:pimeloyl-ACP methyl ester carboxylesterase
MTQVNDSRVVHGHRISFVRAGSGPALVLLHGIGNNCQTWAPVIDRLAETHTVIAPDLLGHGKSDKPRGDYSVAAFANGVRDLMSVLDIERATVVGHSLGGGIALQFAYQFPERCERLVLVSSGGLGPELSASLRAATLPGAELVLTALTGISGPLRAGFSTLDRLGQAAGLRRVRDLAEVGETIFALKDVEARRAFLRTLRGVVDSRGQAVSALDRLYLARALPMLVVWGSRDPIVPALHAETVRELVPGARVEMFEGAGHWAHLDDPDRFCAVLLDFLTTTEAAAHDRESWRSLLAQEPLGTSAP